jgi:predicted amidophosphoribosyltransferase
MDWQVIFNVVGAAVLSVIGWFARVLWDSVQELRKDIKQIEIHLPSNYVQKNELSIRFDRIEQLLDRLYEKMEQKADR